MARIPLGALTTLNLSTHLDPQFVDLYNLREMVTTVGYTAATQRLIFGTGGIIESLADWATNSAANFSLTNPSVRLGIGYTAADHAEIQAYDGAGAARNITVNRYGGNVGIGITPVTRFHTYSATGNTQLRLESGSASGVAVSVQYKVAGRTWEAGCGPGIGDDTFTIYDVTAGIVRMRISAAGNVGIGGVPTTLFHVQSASDPVMQVVNTTGGGNATFKLKGGTGDWLFIADGSDNALRFYDSRVGAERMRVNGGGEVCINSTAPAIAGRRFSVTASSGDAVAAVMKNNPSSSAVQTVDVWNAATTGNNGLINFATEVAGTLRGSISFNRGGGLVAYNTTSDHRSKDLIGPIVDTGASIDAMKPIIGRMHGATQDRPMFVAHELQEVAPYAVMGEKDAVDFEGNPLLQQVDVSVLVPLLVAELQDVRARLAELESS